MNRIFKSDSRVRVAALVLLAVMVGLVGFWGHGAVKAKAAVSSAVSKADVQTRMASLPLVFEPNRGQTDSRFQFFARSNGYKAYLNGPTTALVFAADPKARQADVVSMKMVGANPAAKGRAEQPTGGVSNYYIGNDHSKWHTGIPNYAQVRYTEMYPGIDVVYQGNTKRLRYDFQVKPGADPKAIRMAYEGTKTLSLDEKGNLVIPTAHGQLVGQKPYVYQEIGGQKHVVDANYALTAKNEVTFQIGQYDASQALVIDPTTDLQAYGTYLGPAGGVGDTQINGIQEDGAFAYVAGTTSNANFPAAGTLQGGSDVFVAKLPLGTLGSTSYNDFFGGVNNDTGNAIAVQGGNAAVVGQTTSASSVIGGAFPTLNPLEANPNNIAPHAFVLTVNSTGALTFSTVLSGGALLPGVDSANGVAMEQTGANAGRIHVVGTTSSSNFIGNMPNGATLTTNAKFGTLNTSTGNSNAFYMALAPNGASVVYATFSGGHQNDTGNAIAVDSTGKAYITGNSTFSATASNNIGGSGAFTTGTHAFDVKYDPSKTKAASQVWAAAIGTAGNTETGNGIAVDSANNSYVGGNLTPASGTTVTFSAPATKLLLGTATNTTDQNGFLTEIGPTGGTVVYATLVNGDKVKGNGGGPAGSNAAVTAVAVDSIGQAYITGSISAETDATYTPANPAVIIHRRAYAGGQQVTAGTPFFTTFPSQVTTGNVAIEPIGDIPVGPGGALATVNEIIVQNGGSGYAASTTFALPAGDFSGGCTTEPTGTATTDSNGTVTSIAVNTAGSGCTSAPTVTIPPPGGPGTTATAVAVLTNNTGQGNAVAYDPNTGTSCLAGFVSQALPATNPPATGIIQPSAVQNTFNSPAGAKNGLIVCTPFINDVVIISPGGINNSTITFSSMPAGTNPPSSASIQISAVIPSNPNLPTGITAASLNGSVIYTPPGNSAGPLAGVDGAAHAWLAPVTVNGDTITLSLSAEASKLDPGMYTATMTGTPTAGDNAGVPITITIKFTVTGTLDVNGSFGGGTPASGFTTLVDQAGLGFSSGTGRFLIPVVSDVPILSPSTSNIVFTGPATLDFTDGNGHTATAIGTVNYAAPDRPAGSVACQRPNTGAPTFVPANTIVSNSTACYIEVNINGTTGFAGLPAGTYTSSLQLSAGSPNLPSTATVDTTVVPNPAPIAFSINVQTGNLFITGGNTVNDGSAIFSVPFSFNGSIDSSANGGANVITLNAQNLGTTAASNYTASAGQLQSVADLPAGTCTTNSPTIPGTILTLNGSPSTNPITGVLPAANSLTPTTTLLVGISNPSALAAGFYGDTITVTPTPANGAPATFNVCLSVGNIVTSTVRYNTGGDILPAGVFIEAGSAPQTPTLSVVAVGTTSPTGQYAPPVNVNVPVTLTTNSKPSFVTVTPQTTGNGNGNPTPACDAGAISTTVTCTQTQVKVAPPFATTAGAYSANFTITATGTGLNAAAVPNPTVTIPITVTSGLATQYSTPGAPSLAMLTPQANTFIFNEVATTGVVNAVDGNTINVNASANGGTPTTSVKVFVSDLTFSSFNFLNLLTGIGYNSATSCHGAAGVQVPNGTAAPTSTCSLSINLNNGGIAGLPVGQYIATFNINATTATGAFNTGNFGEQAGPNVADVNVQPAQYPVTLILNVTPNEPTIVASPVAPFSFTIGTPGGATVPVSQNLGLAATFLPPGSQNIAFTATPVSNGNFILLNGGTGTVNGTLDTNPADTKTTPGGAPVVISINTANLTVAGSPYNGTIHITIPNNGTNPQVINPSFDIGVTVNVFAQPTIELNGGTAAVPMAFSWTVGQATTAPAAQTATVTILGQDTYTVTTSQPWIVATLTNGGNQSSTSSNTLNVSINTALAPTAPGPYTGTVTLTGNAAETATVNVTLNVHATPTINASAIPTLTIAAGSTSTTLTSNVGLSASPDNPTTLPVNVSITNAAGNPASCGNFLTVANGNPTSLSGTAAPFNFTANETGVAPGMCSATVTFTTTGGVTPAISQSINVTMNVQGSIGITCGNNVTCTTGAGGNTTLNYQIGSAAPQLPIIVTTNPTPESVTLTSDNPAVAVSPQQALSTVNGTVSLNTAVLTTPGTQTATITASVPASALNCANPVGGFCTQSQTFTVNVTAQPVISLGTNPNFVNGGLLFNEIIGGGGTTPNQLTQNITVAVSGGSATFTATATDLNCTNCITVPPGPYTASNPGTAKVNAAATVPVTVNLSGLAPGTYFGTITLAAQAPAIGTVTVPVTLVVAAQPTIGLTNTTVTLKHTLNVTNAATNTVAESVTATNTLNQPYPFTASVDAGASWLLINGSNTTPATGNTPGNFTIGYNPAGLTPGTYNGSITVSVPNAIGNPASGSTSKINVTLTVAAVPLLQAQGVALSGVTGGAAVSSTINVTSSGHANGDEIAYTISSSSVPAGWLSATAVGGNSTTPGAITVTATPGNLAPGTYNGTVTLTPTNAQLSPITLNILFNVVAPTAVVTLPGGAQSANFSVTMNNPASASAPITLSLANSVTPSSTVSFTASASPSANWLSLNGGAGPVTGTTPATITLALTPTAATLAAGNYSGLVTINFTGSANSTVTIPVTLTVNPPAVCTFSFSGSGTLPFTGTATTSPTAPNGVFPSTSTSITATPGAGCVTGTTFTVTADHPEWLTVTQTATGFNFVALANAHTTPRSATVTVTPTNTGTSNSTPTTFSITEPASTLSLTQRQVVALYQQILGREPDQGGFNFWTGQGAASLGQMADSFLTSPEAQGSDFAVLEAYQGALGRFPSFNEYETALLKVRAGTLTVSALYTQLLGTSTNSQAITIATYLNLLGRAPTSAELTAGTAMTPFQLFSTIIGGAEFQNGTGFRTAADHTNFLYIKMLYFVILQRDSDNAGFNFWLGVANGGGPGIYFNNPATRVAIEGPGTPGAGFIGSNEFQGLFQ